jgi:hypothetical protein
MAMPAVLESIAVVPLSEFSMISKRLRADDEPIALENFELECTPDRLAVTAEIIKLTEVILRQKMRQKVDKRFIAPKHANDELPAALSSISRQQQATRQEILQSTYRDEALQALQERDPDQPQILYYKTYQQFEDALVRRLADELAPYFISFEGAISINADVIDDALNASLFQVKSFGFDPILEELKAVLKREYSTSHCPEESQQNEQPVLQFRRPYQYELLPADEYCVSTIAQGGYTLYFTRMLVDRVRYDQQKGTRKMHKLRTLDEERFIHRVRVRLATEADIGLYMDLENPHVQWLDRVKEATAHPDGPTDIFGLHYGQRHAMEEFQTKGGHISRLPQNKIEFILKNGAIAILEYEVARNVYVTLGSVSALLPIPCTPLPEDPARAHLDLHPLFPNFDLRGIKMPKETLPKAIAERQKRLLICRSTVRDRLTEAQLLEETEGRKLLSALTPAQRVELQRVFGMDLRRLGLAARGKAEIFHLAQGFDFKTLTFNIGRMQDPTKSQITMVNGPSQAHNDWMKTWAWRDYYDVVIPEIIRMYWMAYDGEIADGLDEFERIDGGLLSGKLWDIHEIDRSATQSYEDLLQRIHSGAHEPINPAN